MTAFFNLLILDLRHKRILQKIMHLDKDTFFLGIEWNENNYKGESYGIEKKPVGKEKQRLA